MVHKYLLGSAQCTQTHKSYFCTCYDFNDVAFILSAFCCYYHVILSVSDTTDAKKTGESSKKKTKDNSVYDKVYFDSDSDEELTSKGNIFMNHLISFLILIW